MTSLSWRDRADRRRDESQTASIIPFRARTIEEALELTGGDPGPVLRAAEKTQRDAFDIIQLCYAAINAGQDFVYSPVNGARVGVDFTLACAQARQAKAGKVIADLRAMGFR